MNKKYLVIIVGPTGIGKTDLTIELALHFNTVIISADSRQFYKELPIGTAVPTDEQRKKVTHHFIGNLTIHDYYNAGKFEIEVLELLTTLYKSHNIIFMTGGSGLYIDAVTNGIDVLPEVDREVRNNLLQIYHQEGIESLRRQLKILDPAYYEKVDLRNHKRILKALEICLQKGKPYSSLLNKPKKKRPFTSIKIGLQMERAELYERINNRIDKMIETGLLNEARANIKYKNINALNTVGYKEIYQYLDGKIDIDTAIEKIKNNTHKYARKQLTWFNKDKKTIWFHPSEKEKIIEFIEKKIQ